MMVKLAPLLISDYFSFEMYFICDEKIEYETYFISFVKNKSRGSNTFSALVKNCTLLNLTLLKIF